MSLCPPRASVPYVENSMLKRSRVNDMNELVEKVEQIIDPAYLVGGPVRDTLLGRKPKDFDFASPLVPDEIEQHVKAAGKRAYITGKRFGTVGFTVNGQFVEVTTFRSETYGKTRKPEVEFVGSINEDLSRRDFTINAIAQRKGKLIDPFDGQEDLSSRVIRAVGNPSVRFNEDPLRMLRAARFVAQLDFSIEEKTLASIRKNAHKVMNVSKERWIQELDKLLIADNATKGLQVLADSDLLKFVLPELRLQVGYDQNSDWHDLTLWEHTLHTVDKTKADITLRWAALLHDVGKPFVRTENIRGRSNYVFHDTVGTELIYGVGKRLKWSNERLHAVSELVKHHLEDDSPLREADNSSKKKALL